MYAVPIFHHFSQLALSIFVIFYYTLIIFEIPIISQFYSFLNRKKWVFEFSVLIANANIDNIYYYIISLKCYFNAHYKIN